MLEASEKRWFPAESLWVGGSPNSNWQILHRNHLKHKILLSLPNPCWEELGISLWRVTGSERMPNIRCIHTLQSHSAIIWKKKNAFTSFPHCMSISLLKTTDNCTFYSLVQLFPVWNWKHAGLHSSRTFTPGSLCREWVTGTCCDGEVIIVTPPVSAGWA